MVPDYRNHQVGFRLVTPDATVAATPRFAELVSTLQGEVAEPIEWRNVRRRQQRNRETHGFGQLGIDGTIQVILDGAGGSSVVREIVNQHGPHVNLYMAIGYDDDAWQELERYRFDLNTYKEVDHEIKVSLESGEVFHSRFMERVSTIINVFDHTALTGDYIGYPESTSMTLHSRALFEQHRSEYLAGTDDSTGVFPSKESNAYVQPGFSKVTVEQLEGVPSQPIAITETRPHENSDHLFTTLGGGRFTVRVNIQGQATYDYTGIHLNIGLPSFQWTLRTDTQILYTTPGPFFSTFNRGVPYPVSIDEEWVIDLQPNESVYLYANMGFKADRGPNAETLYSFQETSASLAIDGETLFPETEAEAQTVFSVAERIVAHLTGTPGRVKSTLLEPGGCLADLRCLPGFYIRGFHPLEQPFLISWEKLMKGLNSLWAIGWNIEFDQFGPLLVIEEFEYFYQAGELGAPIRQYTEYERSRLTDFHWNTFTFGDQNAPEEEPNALDEHNGKTTWVMPYPEGNDLKQLSPIVTSGYIIERTRRRPKSTYPRDTTSYDGHTFFIQGLAGANRAEANEAFSDVSGIFAPTTAYNLRHSPRRRALRWQGLLSAALFGIGDTAKIRHSATEGNPNLETRLRTDFTCPGGDPDRAVMVEGSDLEVQDLRKLPGQFTGWQIRLTTEQSRSLYDDLERAHQGQLEGFNYGKLIVIDPFGIIRKGWVLDNPRDEESGEVQLILIEAYE